MPAKPCRPFRPLRLLQAGMWLAAAASLPAQACVLETSLTETAEALLAPLPEQHLDGYLGHLSTLSGCEFKINRTPLARTDQLFQHRQIQVMVGFIQTPLRDKAGLFHPLIPLQAYWLSLSPPPASGDLSSLMGWKDLRIGIVRGAHFPPALQSELEQLRRSGQLDEADNEASAIGKLRAKRDLAYVMTDVQYFALRKRNALGGLGGWPLKNVPPLEIGLYLNDRALTPVERRKLREAIVKARQERYIAQLLAARIGYAASR